MFVVVSAPDVVDVVDQAGALGVEAVCVISAGFAEVGEDGAQRQRELVEVARRHGTRVVGPNCMGVLNAAEGMRMNGTFSHAFPRPGRVALLSQSGALGLAVLGHADELGIGMSSFVSVGNAADVTGTDVLSYWEHDEDTDVVLLYLESFDRPRRFSRLARRISRDKPIIAVKSGRTGAGREAASSHTAAVAGRDVAVDALFAQTGVIRTDTLPELFEVTSLLTNGYRLRGDRVGIVTNGGGPGILAADACAVHELDVPELGDATQQRLGGILPAEAATRNPVDVLAGADAAVYRDAIRVVGSSDEVDVVLVIFIPPIVVQATDVADAVVEASRELPDDVPVVGVFMGGDAGPSQLVDAGIASFPYPEEAVRAVGHAARWSRWKRTPRGSVVRPEGIDPERARVIVEEASGEGEGDEDGTWLTTAQAMELLDAYGVPTARTVVVYGPQEAARAQERIAAPVAVKVDAPIHKADVGGGCAWTWRRPRMRPPRSERSRRTSRTPTRVTAQAATWSSGWSTTASRWRSA